MNLRQAYKMVIMHQLELLEEKGQWVFDEKEKLVEELHEDYDFLMMFLNETEEFLETFGENYDLF